MKKNKFFKFIFFTIILFLISFSFVACANKEISKHEKSDFAFGTYIKIITYTDDAKKAEKAIEKAFEEMKRIDEKYNSKNEKSLIYALNTKKVEEIELDKEGLEIFSEVKKMYELSHGKYDITIAPLMALWGFTDEKIDSNNLRLPTKQEIEFVKKNIDFSKVIIENNKMYYEKSVKEIDTGSFIKGYAIKKAMEVMKQEGLSSSFVSAISSIEIGDKKPNGKQWRIALENPENIKDSLGIISTNNKALGVSADYQTYIEIDKKKYHHIIDKESGYPVADKKMVAVLCENGFLADLYSTTFFLMPIDEVLNYVEQEKNLDVLIVDKDNKIFKTEGFVIEKAN